MLKSSYELAMERLGNDAAPLTAEQKAELAEIDSKYKAMIAEKDIIFSERVHAARISGDMESVDALTSELAEERARLDGLRNRDKDRCRNQA